MVEQDIEFITFDGTTITKSENRNRIIDHFIQSNHDGLTKITDFSVGSEAYHLADLIAVLMLEHREDIDNNYRMSMIHYAEGEFLDNFGDTRGVHRHQSSPSRGEVTFILNTPKEEVTIIPDGTVVATDDAISFVLTDVVMIPEGEVNGTGEVICEQEGEYTNVLPNTINIIISDLNINGLTISNPDYFYDGADVEEDDDYRARLLKAPFNAPTATLRWWSNVALSDENVASSVHDVVVRKNVHGYSEDIVMYFRAFNELDTVHYNGHTVSRAYKDLSELFNEAEYDVVGMNVAFVQGESVNVLPASSNDDEYLFAVILHENNLLDDVKDDIESCIVEYNSNASLGNNFSPDSLVVSIENNVEEVFKCRIIKHNTSQNTYSEVTDNNYIINCADNQYYRIDYTNLQDRITEASFTIDLTPNP